MKIIATGWKSGLSLLENTIRNREVKNALANFGIKCHEIVGSYQNEQELGFIFEVKPDQLRRVEDLFFKCMHQQSILYILKDGAVTACSLKHGVEQAGILTNVPKEVALNSEGWSYINGDYWVIL